MMSENISRIHVSDLRNILMTKVSAFLEFVLYRGKEVKNSGV